MTNKGSPCPLQYLLLVEYPMYFSIRDMFENFPEECSFLVKTCRYKMVLTILRKCFHNARAAFLFIVLRHYTLGPQNTRQHSTDLLQGPITTSMLLPFWRYSLGMLGSHSRVLVAYYNWLPRSDEFRTSLLVEGASGFSVNIDKNACQGVCDEGTPQPIETAVTLLLQN